MSKKLNIFFLNRLKKFFFFKYFFKKTIVSLLLHAVELFNLKRFFNSILYTNITLKKLAGFNNLCIYTSRTRWVNSKFLLSKLFFIKYIRLGFITGFRLKTW